MATSTTNFGLTKPAYSDTADISDINDNMEAIDTKLAEGVYYGTCPTAAGTQQKDVTAANFPAVLSAGMKLSVKFTNGQTFNGQPTLKVNSLTAKNICSFGTTAAAQYEWQAGEVIDFIYDGTQWVVVNGGIAGTTYYGKTKLTSDLTGTSEWLAATQKAVNTLNSKIDNQIGVYPLPKTNFKTWFTIYNGTNKWHFVPLLGASRKTISVVSCTIGGQSISCAIMERLDGGIVVATTWTAGDIEYAVLTLSIS
jgi:hypothetical protein